MWLGQLEGGGVLGYEEVLEAREGKETGSFVSYEVLEACEGETTGSFISCDRFKFISCDRFDQ